MSQLVFEKDKFPYAELFGEDPPTGRVYVWCNLATASLCINRHLTPDEIYWVNEPKTNDCKNCPFLTKIYPDLAKEL
ncbi:hypothetical protein A2634_00545 [Candidatus Amesbacteria bacterium RIFCSPHIGHO2_01_FULL_48_32]|uniref:Uncharacterized protein n=1 Tax=Candidatus Amesbacteria bacterium RIFCSPLOWO2_01_FULL_48_25 TaxID=1797259 RepID=A0A1F4ZAS6_9BACT|nr:MAG: hypothetical protein A2634_00545 [Candidatus Amesbacteria bacterium RIFCSPHIGHO2_01_FULL_48_32]OGD03295.1 MAG: hypothetical protein A2989_00495 [Candidatus Amesbacteria bacterium RIFCSPLOWO2_01_FULL_48_25]HJZ05244.1 hypothetical protein [Patescibacteria group bacterium]